MPQLTKTDVTFAGEMLKDVMEEMVPLTISHYGEVAHYRDIPLSVDWDRLASAEAQDCLRIYTARTSEKKLVGYAFFIVQTSTHYSGSLQAIQDVIFILPEHRGFGKKFILWCDKQLREEGVEVVYHHVKKEHNFGPMLEKLGYELIDLIYGRRLD